MLNFILFVFISIIVFFAVVFLIAWINDVTEKMAESRIARKEIKQENNFFTNLAKKGMAEKKKAGLI